MVEASVETGRQVGALVHRSGHVDYVIVGDAGRLMLPDIGRLRAAEGRFRGLRLMHTHLRGEPLTRDDLVDLVRLRLDLVCALQLAPDGDRARCITHTTCRPRGWRAAVPRGRAASRWAESTSTSAALMSRASRRSSPRRTRPREVRAKDGRAILVHVCDKKHAHQAVSSLNELRELARTAGVTVVDEVTQVRDQIDPRLVLGKGKLDDVILRAMQLDAQVLIFDRDLTPVQLSAVAKESDLKVIDRTQLILDIFAQRAESGRRQAPGRARAAQVHCCRDWGRRTTRSRA